MSPEKQRRTFLSYSRINKDFALKLATELKASGFPIWIDQLDIPTGARWDDELEKALEECEIFMVILTPSSAASDNVKDEIGYAIDSGKRILPILLKDAKVPLRLRRFQYVDFTSKSFEDGVEGAKVLLRNLTDTPTGPIPKMPAAAVAAPKSQPTQPAAMPATPAAAPAKQPSKAFMIGIGAFVGIGVIIAIILFALSMQGEKAAPPVAPTQVQVQEPTDPPEPTKAPPTSEPEQAASAPEPTQAPPTSEPTAVPASPTPEIQKFFTEDFDGESENWPFFVADGRTGDPVISDDLGDDFSIKFENGSYFFEITRRLVYAYSYYDAFTYNNVRVDARVDSLNVNTNQTRLFCHYSPSGGWYEFTITNNGLYNIYFAKPNAGGLISYRPIANGGSNTINVGNAANEYSIICQGSNLTLIINDEVVKETTDDLSILRSGKVGVAVSSINAVPVVVGVDWVKISEP
jgi:hypothetical protein